MFMKDVSIVRSRTCRSESAQFPKTRYRLGIPGIKSQREHSINASNLLLDYADVTGDKQSVFLRCASAETRRCDLDALLLRFLQTSSSARLLFVSETLRIMRMRGKFAAERCLKLCASVEQFLSFRCVENARHFMRKREAKSAIGSEMHPPSAAGDQRRRDAYSDWR